MKQTTKSNQKSSHHTSGILIALLLVAVIIFSLVLIQRNLLAYFSTIFSSYASGNNSLTSHVIVEAETISTYSLSGGLQIIDDATASEGKALMMSINTTASGQISFPATVSQLIVMAKGERCKGNPSLTVTIDEKQVLNKNVASTSWNDYFVNTSIPAGTHNYAISFTNDYSSTGKNTCDRSLKIDQLIFQ